MNTNITEGLSASATLWSGCVRRTAMALLVMLLTMTTGTLRAAQNDNWEYFINGDQCVLNDFTGTKNAVSTLLIPGTINGAKVVGIGVDLREFTNLSELHFGEGIAITEMPTVSGCKNLKHIDSADGTDCLPASITKVPDYAFTGTKICELTMPGVATVGNHAFEGCNTLGYVTLHKPATIGYEAFAKIYEPQQCVISYPGSVSAWEYTRYHHSPNIIINCSQLS